MALFILLGALYHSDVRASEATEKNDRLPADKTISQVESGYKIWVAWIGIGLSAVGGSIALFTFASGIRQRERAEVWKRTEFLAKEMEKVFSEPMIRNALTMIDWSDRKINLFAEDEVGYAGFPRVSRETQIRALIPHLDLAQSTSWGAAKQGNMPQRRSRFTEPEVRIRDCYDRLLDQLERFGSYSDAELVSTQELGPHFDYWIKNFVVESTDPWEQAWTYALIRYIHEYGYRHVVSLFAKFGISIGKDSSLYQKLAHDAEVQKIIAESLLEMP
jgi:hypothetical protein